MKNSAFNPDSGPVRCLCTAWLCLLCAIGNADTLVIAHRGASGYLPEHTLPAVAAAHAMGADYIEQDVVLTRDNRAIVLHDTTLERTTDVADRFPGRAREDGHFYAVDFDLSEIRQLIATERRDDNGHAVFPQRFPVDTGTFRIPTLTEEIELIQGLNASTGRDVGIYVELKKPAFHAREGRDLSTVVLQVLHDFGYADADDKVFIQCFDAATLKNLASETEIRLVQLLDEEELTEDLAIEIAEYAYGAGPDIEMLTMAPEFVLAAHEAGIQVHAYTFRADQLLADYDDLDALLEHFLAKLAIDGVFTDHPDLARRYVGDGKRE